MKKTSVSIVLFLFIAAISACSNSNTIDTDVFSSTGAQPAKEPAATPVLAFCDTMNAQRGNTNANLNNGSSPDDEWHAIIWRGNLYWRHSITHDLMREDLEGNEDYETGYGQHAEIVALQADPKFFNIWRDSLYVNINGKFVQIDSDGKILQTIIEGVGYCQIYDGWLYFLRESDNQLCRRLLIGGDIEPLGLHSIQYGGLTDMLEVVITDQHIYINDGRSIWKTEPDGNNHLCLLSYSEESQDRPYLNGLEYANGLLYFSIGWNTEQARIYRMDQDGVGMVEFLQEGAAEINIADDWLYYTKNGLLGYLDNEDVSRESAYGGSGVSRVRLDGSGMETLSPPGGPYRSKVCDSPTVMPDGSVYYRCFENNNGDIWYRVR